MSESNGALLVGIDLGTSRCAVSASNGERHLIESYVGWPVDTVARKVLKTDVLVGTKAVQKRSMLDLHRPLEQGLIKEGSEKDLEAVRVLLKTLLHLVGVRKSDQKGGNVRAVVGVPAEAMRTNKQQLRDALKDLVDSLMIVSEPFAVAYGLEALEHSMVVDVGAGTSDFCLMRGRFPTEEDQRTLTRAGDSIDELLLKLVSQEQPDAQVSLFMARDWKEVHGFVGTPQQRALVTAPVTGRPTKLDITEQLRTACESVVAPITETMLDLLPRVEPEFQEKVRQRIILSGGSSQIPGLRAALQEGLKAVGGGKIRNIKSPAFEGSDGGLALAVDAQKSDWDQLS